MTLLTSVMNFSSKFYERVFSPGIPVSSTNKTDYHVITEIFLKVALTTIANVSTKGLPGYIVILSQMGKLLFHCYPL
jgi:hypothetical protein